jgi:hypothetical protein
MICYDFRRQLSKQECIGPLTSTFGYEATSLATVKRWHNEFHRGYRSFIDEIHEGRPK